MIQIIHSPYHICLVSWFQNPIRNQPNYSNFANYSNFTNTLLYKHFMQLHYFIIRLLQNQNQRTDFNLLVINNLNSIFLLLEHQIRNRYYRSKTHLHIYHHKMVEDLYERTHRTLYKSLCTFLYSGLLHPLLHLYSCLSNTCLIRLLFSKLHHVPSLSCSFGRS